MFGLGVLDVGIGLIFLYLLLSLMCTAISEFLAGLANGRGRTLVAGIRQLLHDGADARMAASFYEHPLIMALRDRGRRPSYIPAQTFAAVVLDLLAPSNPGRPRTLEEVRAGIITLPEGSVVRGNLQVLWQEANEDLQVFQRRIESWFDASMERVGGWYKRHIQTLVLVVAVLVSVGTNADTISVATVLSNDSALRQILVAKAAGAVSKSPATPQSPGAPAVSDSMAIESITKQLREMKSLGIPLGWTALPKTEEIPSKALGLLLTALALSLGAPFWFDMLSKIISIRGAGARPGETTKKEPEDAKAPRAPNLGGAR